MFLPAVALQALLLVVAAAVAQLAGWRGWRSVAMSCAATLAAYVIVGGFAFHQLSQLRDQVPYVSMEERLPAPKASGQPLSAAALQHLDDMEVNPFGEADGHVDAGLRRIKYIEQLHEHTVEAFANQPGFGVGRMTPSRWMLSLGDVQPIPQPGTRVTFTWSTGTLEEPGPGWGTGEAEKSWQTHQAGIVDFANPGGFGLVKDRHHVAGFQGHQFSKPPRATDSWVLRTLDLVGLVVNDRPVVYISDHLPSMDELRAAPRRPLDDFETLGLAALRNGDDLFMRQNNEGRRLLGAIRNARRCLECHGGERGDLLGAFSYTFAPESR